MNMNLNSNGAAQAYTLPQLTDYQTIQASPVSNWMSALTQGFDTAAQIAKDMEEASNKKENLGAVEKYGSQIAKIAAFL